LEELCIGAWVLEEEEGVWVSIRESVWRDPR
jgi:hypothetical protein